MLSPKPRPNNQVFCGLADELAGVLVFEDAKNSGLWLHGSGYSQHEGVRPMCFASALLHR